MINNELLNGADSCGSQSNSSSGASRKSSPEHPARDDGYNIDNIFNRICFFCFIIGNNFYPDRSSKQRCTSLFIVLVVCSLNLYAIGYGAYLTLTKPFEPERVAISISICSWVLQATLSTGLGINHYRDKLSKILREFYIVVAVWVIYYVVMITANLLEFDFGYTDRDIPKLFGDRRLFIIVQFTSMYSILCWVVAVFIYSLLIQSTNCEFAYFNKQVQSIKCNEEDGTNDSICNHIINLMKTHSRLTECVKRLDRTFNVYAFVMIATIIPTTIFSLFIIFRIHHTPSNFISQQLLVTCPIVLFCFFSFFSLVNAPSQLHATIHDTKSALCGNTHIWLPYRRNVYHSALAFACHLDQTNLGVSIWGFAVLSKPLVLTTLSVMMTCLALFLQLGDCSNRSAVMTECNCNRTLIP